MNSSVMMADRLSNYEGITLLALPAVGPVFATSEGSPELKYPGQRD